MTTKLEMQAQIAKDITVTLADKLRIPGAGTPAEGANSFIRAEVTKLYEEIFNTVKRLTEE
jgi:hypothetical protein